MKFKIIIVCLFISNCISSQIAKDSLLKIDVTKLVEELELMYGYDQTMREYLTYGSFDKSETNRIEQLSDSLRNKEISKNRFVTDSIGIKLLQKYINPKDAEHTELLIKFTKKYGFPNIKRLKKYYMAEFKDPEFNPLIIFIHSPKKYWEELKVLMQNELKNGTINKCEYGYCLWHFSGRVNLQPMLENGYTMVEENGKKIMKPNCK